MNHMKDMTEIQQLWRRHSNNLKEPEANVRDGEGKVVTHVLTAGLLSVAHKVRLLISPDLKRQDTYRSDLRVLSHGQVKNAPE